MGKLFKFLKPRVGAVLAIVAVLIIQAYCDLSLPGYTSDIVNVGIQQGGIDSAIPEQIAKDDMEKLLLFVSKDDQKIVIRTDSQLFFRLPVSAGVRGNRVRPAGGRL